MPAPLSLSDMEMDAVLRAAAPIDPGQRDAFLKDLADELSKCPEALGPGSLYRTIHRVQARYFSGMQTAYDALVGRRP
jgi:hypothetical protein